jgi:pentachlorophenol monooxygenase/3-(3-hydroxy-phenyl)propionate hydroxylase
VTRRRSGIEPVAVVGNGPVGQTTALLLARWGVPVVLLDRRCERDPVGSKAICQQRDVLDVWESVGAGHRIADEGITWTTARTFYQDRELFSYALPEPGHPAFPPFVNLSQARIEEILDERIAGEQLIDVRWDHRVDELAQSADEVRLTCGTPAGKAVLRAPWVVVCAGARGGALRRQLGVAFDGRSFDDRFLICDVRTTLPGWREERRFYFDPRWNPRRQVLIHPCPDSTFRIDWQVPADYDLDAEERSGALEARIRAVIGDQDYDLVWSSVYRFQSRCVDRMRVGRVLLAGDFAHLYSPFGARGLNSGVQDADNAAWKLAFVLRGWAGESLMDSYDAERRAAAQENFDVTSTTMRFLVPHDDVEWERRRSVLERARTDRSAWSEVDSGRLAEPFWYDDSPLTTPNPWRRCGGRPPRGQLPRPAPGVLVPDLPVVVAGAPTRLRQVARDGFLLLAVGRSATTAAEHAAGTTRVPARVLDLEAIDVAGELSEALSARSGEVWVVRPDAHVAAVLEDPRADHVASTLARALAEPPSAPPPSRRTERRVPHGNAG